MLPLNPNIQDRLMIIPLAPRPLQTPHLILIEAPPDHILELLATDLLARLLLLVRLQAWLEPGLHADTPSRIERDLRSIASHLDR